MLLLSRMPPQALLFNNHFRIPSTTFAEMELTLTFKCLICGYTVLGIKTRVEDHFVL